MVPKIWILLGEKPDWKEGPETPVCLARGLEGREQEMKYVGRNKWWGGSGAETGMTELPTG